MQQQQDDIALIQDVLKGQTSSYAVIVNRYQSYVFTIVMRYVSSREVAEELAQDVFVKAYKCLADFKGNSKFSTWLYTITVTTCLSYLRKKQDKTVLPGVEKLTILADSEYLQPPTENMERKTQRQMLAAAMTHLADDDATILTLYYLAELSVAETAIVLGMMESNVKVRLMRARQKMKHVLETKYGGEI